MNNFKLKLDTWLGEVAHKCDEFASNKDFDLDFYVFQSAVNFNPKLMIIGANPGRNISYFMKNKGKGRTKYQLGENENTFIKYYNEPDWVRLKPLYDMFKGNSQLEEYFKNAVITNLSYFNSGTFKVLKDKMKVVGREPLNFCIQKNIELIKNIVKPQNIILMGAPARDNFSKFLDGNPFETIIETKSSRYNKSVPLIKKSSIAYTDNSTTIKIPVYIIEHPSAWNGLNSKDNVELKRDMFVKIFCNN
jgi:hypothetical protein